MSDLSSAPLFSAPVNVKKLTKKGSVFTYDAPEEVRAKIAAAYDLLAVESFETNAIVTPWRKNGVKVSGEVRANLLQPCSITLEPLEVSIIETVDALYVPEGSKLASPRLDGEGEILVEPEGPDLPETFTGDVLDLGGVWLEFFALSLDPFAHKEGASLADIVEKEADFQQSSSPFAALASLKKH